MYSIDSRRIRGKNANVKTTMMLCRPNFFFFPKKCVHKTLNVSLHPAPTPKFFQGSETTQCSNEKRKRPNYSKCSGFFASFLFVSFCSNTFVLLLCKFMLSWFPYQFFNISSSYKCGKDNLSKSHRDLAMRGSVMAFMDNL